MMMFGIARRLSIDIDIIVPEKYDLIKIFENVVKTKWFSRYSEQKRKSQSEIPKSHFKFFYNPVYRTSEAEDYVLLDILFDKSHYQKVESIPVNSAFVEQDGPMINVSVPSFDDILGDKLTAFAPNTTGIPYQKNGHSQTMEIIKQLYDIGYLFDSVEDLSVVAKTFNEYVVIESGYKRIKLNPGDVV